MERRVGDQNALRIFNVVSGVFFPYSTKIRILQVFSHFPLYAFEYSSILMEVFAD